MKSWNIILKLQHSKLRSKSVLFRMVFLNNNVCGMLIEHDEAGKRILIFFLFGSFDFKIESA